MRKLFLVVVVVVSTAWTDPVLASVAPSVGTYTDSQYAIRIIHTLFLVEQNSRIKRRTIIRLSAVF